MKRILVLTPWFPNTLDQQPGAFVAASATSLAKLGYEVEVAVARPYVPALLSRFAHSMIRGTLSPQDFRPHLSVRAIHYPALPRFGQHHAAQQLRDRFLLKGLLRPHSRFRPEVIHVHSEGLASTAASLRQALQVPVVLTIHGLDERLLAPGAEKVRARIGSQLSTLDRIILAGEPLRPFYASIMPGNPEFAVVPNGIDLPATGRTSALLSSPTLRLISVSNLHETKGIDTTLRALAHLKAHRDASWIYSIAGDGYYRPFLESLAKDLGLSRNVRFLGPLRPSQVTTALQDADIFVLPSVREAFGIAYLEAMAAGLVTIGVKDQGPSAFIDHGVSGYLVEPGSVESLAACLDAILREDRETLKAIADRGEHVARSGFTWAAHGEKLAAVLRHAVEAPAR